MLCDSGLLRVQLGIRTEKDLLPHPRSGAWWEGYGVEKVLTQLQPDQAYFWATHEGAELDLCLFENGPRLGIDIKRADATTLTASIRAALVDVLFPGKHRKRAGFKVQ